MFNRKDGALELFRSRCENACAEQEKLIMRLLAENSGTEYGKRFGFSGIHSRSDYAKQVPLSESTDYEEYISRIINGERDIITVQPPVIFNISAGSTGVPKYIPICREDVEKQHLYEDCAVAGIIKEALPECTEEELFGDIFNIGDFFQTYMPDGIMNGVRSGAYFRTAKNDGIFESSHFSIPEDVMFPEKLEDMLYVKLRFALSDRNVTAIHGVFIHRTVGVFRYLEEHWDELLDDMENGTISDCFAVSEYWRDYIVSHLPPDPGRAAELRSYSGESLADGMLCKIWPRLRYIRVISGTLFVAYNEHFRRYAGNLPIHNFAYASSESVIGIAPRMNVSDEYVLLPDVCYYEFIPEEQINAPRDVMTIENVRTGERYELVVTTLSGLYRYRMGDIVEIVGMLGESPAVRICYRKNLVISLSDESMNIMQFEAAMTDFCGREGITADGFCICGNYDEIVPHYVMFIECHGMLRENSREILDDCFCRCSLGYRGARNIGDLGCAEIHKVRQGTFRRYENMCWSEGKRNEQAKPLRILTDKDQINFFERAGEN